MVTGSNDGSNFTVFAPLLRFGTMERTIHKKRFLVRKLNWHDCLGEREREKLSRRFKWAVIAIDGRIVEQCLTPARAEAIADHYEEMLRMFARPAAID